MMVQSRYWRCMYPKQPQELSLWTDRLHGMDGKILAMNGGLIGSDIIRQYQSKQLYDNFKLTPLYIYRTAISKSFENQVLARYVGSPRLSMSANSCSSNYNKQTPLLVVFHDP